MAKKAAKRQKARPKPRPRKPAKKPKTRKKTARPAKKPTAAKKTAKPAPPKKEAKKGGKREAKRPPAKPKAPTIRPLFDDEETVCSLEFLSDGRAFIARIDTIRGGMREHRAPAFVDLLELVAEDLREEFLET